MRFAKIRRYLHYFRRFVQALSKVPKPGTPFDSDKFVDLLLYQWYGFTTPAEDEYICLQIEHNSFAYELAQDVENTLSGVVPFAFPVTTGSLIRAAAWIPVSIALVGGIYALSLRFQPGTVTVPQQNMTYQITNASLREVGKIIEQSYGIKVTFEKEKIAEYRISGYLDTKQRLEDFLGDLQISHGIAYTFDENKKVLHFR